jgi:60 kDa SS-A/Ro ribonucleoprotein
LILNVPILRVAEVGLVVGMVSNDFSIADPNDGGMLDVVGFDTATPQLMADFMGE